MLFKENIRAWEALYITSQTGNVSSTAILMDLDASKVSRLVAGLEKELGYEVIDRHHRPFTLTDKGERLVEMLQPLMDSFNEVREYSQGMVKTSRLRIAAPPELVNDFYISHFLRYSLENPSIQFVVRPEATERDVLSGKIDVAMMNYRPTDTTHLNVRTLLINTTPVLATPEYVRRFGVPKQPEDLAQHTGLIQESGNQVLTHFLYRAGKSSRLLKWKRHFISHDQFTLKTLLLQHQGITVDLFVGHVIKELNENRIIPILPGWERRPWELCLVTNTEREMASAELHRFVQWWAETERQEGMDRSVQAREAVSRAFQRLYRKETLTRYASQCIPLTNVMNSP